jgi:hypothetical protein
MQYDHYGIKETRTYTIASNYLKISDGHFDFIYDGESKQIRIVNHSIKAFYMGSFEDYKTDLRMLMDIDSESADRVLPQSWFYSFGQLLLSRIAENRVEQRQTAAAIKVRNTGNSRSIAMEDAREYEVYLDTVLMERIWLAREVNLRNEIDFIGSLNFFRGIEGSVLAKANQLDVSAFEQLAFQGFPMKIVQLDNLGMESYTEECLMVQKQDIDIERTFFPSSGYAQRTLVDIITAEKK